MSHIFSPVISASLSPNTQKDDVLTALRVLCTPWTWRYGRATPRVERWFRDRFCAASAVSFNSARSALLAILSALGVGHGDEVLVQAFTCVAVPNSVLWAGATPVYVDIGDTYNIDVFDMERKRTKRTKAVIVQHTFGIPASMDAIIAFAHTHNLLVIEDCAHSLGATYNGKEIGTFGDAAFFSFGRDKIVSSVWGGVGIIRTSCSVTDAADKLEAFQRRLPVPGLRWIAQQLLHPIVFPLIIRLYNLGFGKIILVVLQTLHMLSFPVLAVEKQGGRPIQFPAQYPNALAQLLIGQLAKLPRYAKNRRDIAKFYISKFSSQGMSVAPYDKGASYVRFPFEMIDPDSIRKHAKHAGVLLGNWYGNVIDPVGVDMHAIGYVAGSCPIAERIAPHIVNLPTRISWSQAKRVCELFLVP